MEDYESVYLTSEEKKRCEGEFPISNELKEAGIDTPEKHRFMLKVFSVIEQNRSQAAEYFEKAEKEEDRLMKMSYLSTAFGLLEANRKLLEAFIEGGTEK